MVGAGRPNDAQIQADVMKSLDNKRFKDVKASVQNGVVTLTGTVDLYSAKHGCGQPGASSQECEGRGEPDSGCGADGRRCDAAEQAGGEAGV